VTKLYLASLSRQDIPEEKRQMHYLYADEIESLIHGVNFSSILSQSRKYRLSLTIATQHLASLPPETLSAVFGNCATISAFRVGGEDALPLVRHFGVSGEGPQTADTMYHRVIPALELLDLPNFQFYLRTLKNDRPHEPFLVRSFPPF